MKGTQENLNEEDRRSRLPDSIIKSFTFSPKSQPSSRDLRPRMPSLPKDALTEPKHKKQKLGSSKEEKEKDEDKEVLRNLPDHIRLGIQVLICGINPGLTSSRKQAHFAHHSNHFWRCLQLSGLTPTQLSPSQDHTLPDQESPYLRIGLTNLCGRPSRDASMLAAQEYVDGIPILLAKLRTVSETCRLVNFVGKGIAQEFEKVLKATEEERGTKLESREVRVPTETPLWTESNGLGLQSYAVSAQQSESPILFFTVVSTSGRVTSHQLPQKAELFKQMRLLAERLATPTEQRTGETWKKISVKILREPEMVTIENKVDVAIKVGGEDKEQGIKAEELDDETNDDSALERE